MWLMKVPEIDFQASSSVIQVLDLARSASDAGGISTTSIGMLLDRDL